MADNQLHAGNINHVFLGGGYMFIKVDMTRKKYAHQAAILNNILGGFPTELNYYFSVIRKIAKVKERKEAVEDNLQSQGDNIISH